MTSLIAAVCWAAAALHAQPAPLFHVGFEGSPEAAATLPDITSITPFASRTGPYIPGPAGQARVLGGKNTCTYHVNAGFYPPRGTCSLWVAPHDWQPSDTANFVFFASFTHLDIQREYIRVILYKYFDADELLLLVQDSTAEAAGRIQLPIGEWRRGEWHHLAFTWNEERYRLFVDGSPVGECPAVKLPDAGRWEIALGTPYAGWAYIGNERTAIDEFTVQAEVLTEDEIRHGYAALASTLPAPPEPTPEQAPIPGNLALSSHGALVLASSFADYEAHYPDNLLDGDGATVWRPFDGVPPHWLEIRWPVPVRVSEVIARRSSAESLRALALLAWDQGAWTSVSQLKLEDQPGGNETRACFDEVLTPRLRVEFPEGLARGLDLTALAARGATSADALAAIARGEPRSTPDGGNERVQLASVSTDPPRPRPEQSITANIRLRPTQPLSDDYVFVLELSDEVQFPQWDNLTVARAALEPDPPSSQWPAGETIELAFTLTLPEYAPDGPIPLRLRGYGIREGGALDVLDAAGERLSQIAEIVLNRATEPAAPPQALAADFATGAGAFTSGAEPQPIAWSLTAPSFDRYHHYSATGVRLYHLKDHPLKYNDEPGTIGRACAHLDARIRAALRVDPAARFIVDVDLRPSTQWLKRHPEERLVTASGNIGPVSFSSSTYNEGADRHLRAIIRHLSDGPYADHVIGYLPMSFGQPDSAMGGTEENLFQTDRSKLTVGDYNPQAINEFRRWLRDRYNGSVEDLRAAWQDPEITFDTAMPVPAELTAEGADGGVFRDPLGSAMTFDYAEWLSGVMGRFYSRTMRIVKEETNGRGLAGAYYGYNVAHLRSYNSPGSWLQNNNFDLVDRLGNPDWDFFAAPMPYSSRRAGTSYYTSFTHDSLRLHGKLLMGEMDHRTFVAEPTTYGRLRSDRETEGVLKRDTTGMMIDGHGYWFADWSKAQGREGVGWFTEPGILDTIRETREVHRAAFTRPKQSVSEIAVFTSGRTMAYHDVYRASPIYHNLILLTLWDAMGKIGAPYDTYSLRDLGAQSVQEQYKLHVFLNAFFLTPEDRRHIEQLKRDGKTLLFFYAPGYVSRETGNSVGGITEVTGMAVQRRADKELMEYQVADTDHPILQGIGPSHACGIQPFNYELSRELHPPEFGPVFRIRDPDADVLARYPDGDAALAIEEHQGWRSVYCAVPRMTTALLRGIARHAGVSIYCDEDVVLKADNRFLMLHNGPEADRELRVVLPNARDVRDAYTGELVARGASDLSVPMRRMETVLYALE